MSTELCSACGRNPRRHPIQFTGEVLCDGCFRNRFVERVRGTINRYRLLSPRSRIVVGVSGSPESIALAKVTWELESRYEGARISFIHVLRWGNEEEADAIEDAFRRLHMPTAKLKPISLKEKRGFYLSELVDENVITRVGICMACRLLVPSTLTIEVARAGGDVIAYGDTADELAEEALYMLSAERYEKMVNVAAKRDLAGGRFCRVLPLSHALKAEASGYLSTFGFHLDYACPYVDVKKEVFSGLTAKLEAKKPGSAFSAIGSFLNLAEVLRQR
jgi:tRNA(Ile)-lysidine synthase TilS/MesJ